MEEELTLVDGGAVGSDGIGELDTIFLLSKSIHILDLPHRLS